MPVLLKNATADGPGPVVRWPGGAGTFWVDGDPDGATVTLEANVVFQGTPQWRPTDNPSLEVKGEATVNFELGRCQLRAVVSKAGASTELTVTVTPFDRGR